MTLKIAFGFISIPFTVDRNDTTRQVVQSAQNAIRNIFPVGDSRIEIILSSYIPHCELQDKLPESDVLLREFTDERDIFLYARIIQTINNIEYIKTYHNEIIYFKREDVFNGFNSNTPFLTDEQMQTMHLRVPERVVEGEQCIICCVNNVGSARLFNCLHLYCTTCTNSWNSSCPLCRSNRL